MGSHGLENRESCISHAVMSLNDLAAARLSASSKEWERMLRLAFTAYMGAWVGQMNPVSFLLTPRGHHGDVIEDVSKDNVLTWTLLMAWKDVPPGLGNPTILPVVEGVEASWPQLSRGMLRIHFTGAQCGRLPSVPSFNILSQLAMKNSDQSRERALSIILRHARTLRFVPKEES